MDSLSSIRRHTIASSTPGKIFKPQKSTEPSPPEWFPELFEKMFGLALRAGDTIKRLRAQVLKRPAVHAQVDIAKMIQEVHHLMELDLCQSGARVELQVAHANYFSVVNEVQIQQVLVNLIRNALDAMSKSPRDQRTLTITISETADGLIEIAICDTGKGVSPEQVDHIFDTFFSTKPEGLGMGLAISRTIIESHKGRLWMTANSDRGATFHFTLPAKKERNDYNGE